MLDALFAREPELFAEVEQLFLGEQARHEPSSAFDYLFVVTGCPAVGAVHPVVGFRERDANERRLALAALDRKKAEFLNLHDPDPLKTTSEYVES
jgi:hypothetical protein